MSKPVPVPTPETQQYWDKAAQHELWLPYCEVDSKFIFYPRSFCPICGTSDIHWRQLSGRGTLASFIINHRAAPGYEGEAPYVMALVELEEGPRLMSNILEVEPKPEALRVGMPLEVVFEERGDITVPQFRPSSEGDRS